MLSVVSNASKNLRVYKKSIQRRNFSDPVTPLTAIASIVATIGFSFTRVHISKSNQYVVMTGLGIKDIKISKSAFQFPFQKYAYVDLIPKNYSFNLHAMSNQKMEFILPGVFTIGPRDNIDDLKKYAKYLSENNEENNSTDELIQGVIEGETRVLAAQMTIEEIFNDRATFKQNIIKNVQEELDQFGLCIYNANIKELQDSPGSEFFTFMRQKTRQEAEGKARIDTSEAMKKANIGYL